MLCIFVVVVAVDYFVFNCDNTILKPIKNNNNFFPLLYLLIPKNSRFVRK